MNYTYCEEVMWYINRPGFPSCRDKAHQQEVTIDRWR